MCVHFHEYFSNSLKCRENTRLRVQLHSFKGIVEDEHSVGSQGLWYMVKSSKQRPERGLVNIKGKSGFSGV